MILSAFLEQVALRSGAHTLRGAMVFVALQRPLDDLIRTGLGLGRFHPGRPSPWSHCFLLADHYTGPQTPILDCTIRDSQGAIIWDTSLSEALDMLFKGMAGAAGAIYDGVVCDYDHPRVTARGVKCLPGLSDGQRESLVTAGRALQTQDYHYDLPGLLRELVRLLTHIALPPSDRLLFCSAFLQTAYRNALGSAGDFAPQVLSADVTPDEIWYAPLGLAWADDSGQTLAAMTPVSVATVPLPPSTSLADAAPSVTGTRSPTSGALALAASLIDDIQQAMAAVQGREDLPDRSGVLGVLEKARDQALRAQQEHPFHRSEALLGADDYYLSLVQSARHGDAAVPRAARLRVMRGLDIIGLGKYEDLDPGWLASLWHRLQDHRVPFPTHIQRDMDGVIQIAEQATIALAGDWGTGTTSSDLIAARMLAANPDYSIHLGDVYYSGTEQEEQRFVERWPSGSQGAFALNSNHEMYAGGVGYFTIALQNTKFGAQRGLSYFALTNTRWLIVGLDTAYFSPDLLYQHGHIDDTQLRWLTPLAIQARAAQKRLILLTHHHGLDLDLTTTPLWSQVVEALDGGPDFWYWGHVHAGVAFHPMQPGAVQLYARCVGHGGVPYLPFDEEMRRQVAWGESERAEDRDEERRALNGYVWLTLNDSSLHETFYDERGRERWSMLHP